MTPAPGLLPPAASTLAPRTDLLFTAMLFLCGGVALVLCVLVIVFAVRFREGSAAERGRPLRRLRWLEVAWTVVPLLLFLGLYAWTSVDFMRLYRPPAEALPVYVVARQWMWKLQHRNGRREINELHVPLGQPVLLRMTSQDAIHSFFVPAFRLKQDVLPGRYTGLWFTATQLGEFPLLCAEYCGSAHSQMTGRIVVMAPEAYSRWLADGAAQPSLAQYGFTLFRRLGCSGCHAAGSTVHAPLLDGIVGRTVHLQDGRSLVADDNYLRDSILLPRKDVVAGFEPVMPSFAGQLDEEDMRALIAYLGSAGERR
ncbi:MAG: cytochrome c oxidase subunit II [Rubrivivax sp.]|nr:cytochrome c oxidase subunit II [Rubrivivax sp.]